MPNVAALSVVPTVVPKAVELTREDTGPKLARVCELLPSREIRKLCSFYYN